MGRRYYIHLCHDISGGSDNAKMRGIKFGKNYIELADGSHISTDHYFGPEFDKCIVSTRHPQPNQRIYHWDNKHRMLSTSSCLSGSSIWWWPFRMRGSWKVRLRRPICVTPSFAVWLVTIRWVARLSLLFLPCTRRMMSLEALVSLSAVNPVSSNGWLR